MTANADDRCRQSVLLALKRTSIKVDRIRMSIFRQTIRGKGSRPRIADARSISDRSMPALSAYSWRCVRRSPIVPDRVPACRSLCAQRQARSPKPINSSPVRVCSGFKASSSSMWRRRTSSRTSRRIGVQQQAIAHGRDDRTFDSGMEPKDRIWPHAPVFCAQFDCASGSASPFDYDERPRFVGGGDSVHVARYVSPAIQRMGPKELGPPSHFIVRRRESGIDENKKTASDDRLVHGRSAGSAISIARPAKHGRSAKNLFPGAAEPSRHTLFILVPLIQIPAGTSKAIGSAQYSWP